MMGGVDGKLLRLPAVGIARLVPAAHKLALPAGDCRRNNELNRNCDLAPDLGHRDEH